MEPLDFKTLAYATDRSLLLWSLERQELLFSRLDSIMSKLDDANASETAEAARLATLEAGVDFVKDAIGSKLQEQQTEIDALKASNTAMQATIAEMAAAGAATETQISTLADQSAANNSSLDRVQATVDVMKAAVTPAA